MALAGQMPPSCGVSLFSGMSVAGILSSLVYIITLGTGGDSNPILSGSICFISICLTMVVTTFCYFYLISQVS